MSEPRILVAGIGNIFLGDDGFGVEVARRLARRTLPAGVQVRDFGIRGFDLAYAILDGYDLTILVDALARGGDPGTLYVLEPETTGPGSAGPAMEMHAMHPAVVLELVKAFGGSAPQNILVVGCEPETFGPEGEGQMDLSQRVEGAIEEAMRLIESLVAPAPATAT